MSGTNYQLEKTDKTIDVPSEQDTLRTGIQLVRTNAKFAQQMQQLFHRHGLTPPQFDVLANLHDEEGIMQQELATRLLVTKGNVTGVVDRMVALGWIERRLDPEDRRANRLYLTDHGKEKFASLTPEHHDLVHKLMACFQMEEVLALRHLLRKLEDEISKSK